MEVFKSKLISLKILSNRNESRYGKPKSMNVYGKTKSMNVVKYIVDLYKRILWTYEKGLLIYPIA